MNNDDWNDLDEIARINDKHTRRTSARGAKHKAYTVKAMMDKAKTMRAKIKRAQNASLTRRGKI